MPLHGGKSGGEVVRRSRVANRGRCEHAGCEQTEKERGKRGLQCTHTCTHARTTHTCLCLKPVCTPKRLHTASSASSYAGDAKAGRPCSAAHSRLHEHHSIHVMRSSSSLTNAFRPADW